MADKWQGYPDEAHHPGRNFYTVAPSDAADLPDRPKAVICSASGALVVSGDNGVQVTIAVTANVLYPISPKRIYLTGHGAGTVVAFH